jgi:hypothetical protein
MYKVPIYKPPPPPQPIKNRFQNNISPGLIVRGLRYYISHILKCKSSPFCASVLLITMWGPLMWTLPKFRMFQIFLNINSISYSFRSIVNQNGVRYSDSTSYCSKCKQTVCLHYGLDFHLTSTLFFIYIILH